MACNCNGKHAVNGAGDERDKSLAPRKQRLQGGKLQERQQPSAVLAKQPWLSASSTAPVLEQLWGIQFLRMAAASWWGVRRQRQTTHSALHLLGAIEEHDALALQVYVAHCPCACGEPSHRLWRRTQPLMWHPPKPVLQHQRPLLHQHPSVEGVAQLQRQRCCCTHCPQRSFSVCSCNSGGEAERT